MVWVSGCVRAKRANYIRLLTRAGAPATPGHCRLRRPLPPQSNALHKVERETFSSLDDLYLKANIMRSRAVLKVR
jgi:hypothetical protein